MVFTAEMALNSSFASLLKELCAIENQFEPEVPREDVLQHGEDVQDVMATSTPQLDTSQIAEQPCEKEEQGSNVREERTNKLVSLFSVSGLFAINSGIGSLTSKAHR